MFSNCGVCESLLLKVYLFKNTVNKTAKESISLKVQKTKCYYYKYIMQHSIVQRLFLPMHCLVV